MWTALPLIVSPSLPQLVAGRAAQFHLHQAAPTAMVALPVTLLIAALAALSGSAAVRIHPNGNGSLCLTRTGEFTANLSDASVDLHPCTVGNDRQNWSASPPFVTQFSQGGMCLRSRGGEYSIRRLEKPRWEGVLVADARCQRRIPRLELLRQRDVLEPTGRGEV